ncbi:8983_t:CDS:2 [Entrophospora sp. SA101]|nr:8983_t:CDS:2 [Entrophospora sp. SA101]
MSIILSFTMFVKSAISSSTLTGIAICRIEEHGFIEQIMRHIDIIQKSNKKIRTNGEWFKEENFV